MFAPPGGGYGMAMNNRARSNFSYSAVWDDTSSMLRAHGAILVALAGVFVFLPNLLSAYLIPLPTMTSPDTFGTQMTDYIARNWHWQLVVRLINAIGAISILLILFGRGASTVGGAIKASFRLLPIYFIALLISDVVLFFGFLALVIPYLYLFGRLAALGPVVVAENRSNPLDGIRRSFEVTKGHGWAVFGLAAIIFVLGMLLSWIVVGILATIFTLVAGKTLGALLSLIASSTAAAALATVLTVLYAAIYRRLTGEAQASAAPISGI